jgi:hypothetical protein
LSIDAGNDCLERIRSHFYDFVAGGTLSAVIILIVTGLFGLSHYWFFLLFVGAFCAAAYAAWLDEYIPHDLIPVVDGDIKTSTETTLDEHRVPRSVLTIEFALSVRNAGEPTIAETWKLEIPKLNPGLLFDPFVVSYPDGDCSFNEIPTGALRHVQLGFRFDGDYPERLRKLGPLIECAVHFRDVKQKPHFCRFIA